MQERGLIAWMANNPIAANLLLLIVLFGGALSSIYIKKESYPSFPSETLIISVAYPGSSPEEVENGILIKVEEAIQGMEGIDEIRSHADQDSGVVTVELVPGIDIAEAINEVKVRVDGISSFPINAEEPIVEKVLSRQLVTKIAIFGPLSEIDLKRTANRIRDDLLKNPGLTQVDISGVRDYEISIEVNNATLRAYNLSFDQVLHAVQSHSQDLPGGRLHTDTSIVTLRSQNQAHTSDEFERLPVISLADGTQLSLSDIATIRDGFTETPYLSRLNGELSVNLHIYSIGQQDALKIREFVIAYVEAEKSRLPPGVDLVTWQDQTLLLKERIELLLKNFIQGALLVIITLALFLRLSLALWVVVGIPFCVMGAILLSSPPLADLSANVISLFGFILVLGVLVDDAIVTAESVYSQLEKDGINGGISSVIRGVQQVSVTTTFGILTTIVAFTPMLFMSEGIGRFFNVIAYVVIFCLLFSLIETKLILPAHLRKIKIEKSPNRRNIFTGIQNKLTLGMDSFINRKYRPFLDLVLKYRFFTLSLFIAILILSYSLIPSGMVRLVFFPELPSDHIETTLAMPPNTPYSVTYQNALKIERAAWQVNDRYKKESNSTHKVIRVLQTTSRNNTQVSLTAELIPSSERDISSVELARWWRDALGQIPNAKSLTFNANSGPGGLPIEIQLVGSNLTRLRKATSEVQSTLRQIEGVFDIRNSFDSGGSELNITLSEAGKSLGLKQVDLAIQVRQAFFGAEIQRIQRGRHEVRVFVRLPLSERNSINALQDLWIQLPNGRKVPFAVVGHISEQVGVSSIERLNRERIVSIQADLDKSTLAPEKLMHRLQSEILNSLPHRYPGMRVQFAGEAKEQASNTNTLVFGLLVVLFLIYTLLAVPLKSYIQPIFIMSVIPFGIIGGIIGHFFLGIPINIFSITGMLALAGIVVNDSLVFIDYFNHQLEKGKERSHAIVLAGTRRFRAVILTSITTFIGLMPLLFETSVQSQFLKPMAISISFGVLFSTAITLLLVPVILLCSDDLKRLFAFFVSESNVKDKKMQLDISNSQ